MATFDKGIANDDLDCRHFEMSTDKCPLSNGSKDQVHPGHGHFIAQGKAFVEEAHCVQLLARTFRSVHQQACWSVPRDAAQVHITKSCRLPSSAEQTWQAALTCPTQAVRRHGLE